jgi:hypothetical protein
MPDSCGYFTYTTSVKKHDKSLTQVTEKGELMGLVKAISKTYRYAADVRIFSFFFIRTNIFVCHLPVINSVA